MSYDLMNIFQEELQQLLIDETDSDKLKEIIDIFNLNIKKKDIIRANALSDLQDKISSNITKRIDNKVDEFSNKDLLDYFRTVQDILNKSDNSSDVTKLPTIQLNQQNNIAVDASGNAFNKDSRDKIIDAVQSILKAYDSVDVVETNQEEAE